MQIHIFINITNVMELRKKIVLSTKYCKMSCTLDIPYILFVDWISEYRLVLIEICPSKRILFRML